MGRRRRGVRGLAVCLVIAPLLGSILLTAPPAAATSSGTGQWTWSNVSRSIAPPEAAGTMMAYDGVQDRFVFFGGWNGRTLNQTWEFDPTQASWTELQPPLAPVSRADGTLVFDPVDEQFVLFGGWTEYADGTDHRLNDTWTFSLTTDRWTELLPSLAPSPRSDSGALFSTVTDLEYLYGGFSGTSYLADAWTFDPATVTWTPLAPSAPSPGLRADGRMVVDGTPEIGVLFGGNDYSGPNLTFHHLNDTWVFETGVSSLEWTQLVTSQAPPARDYAVEAFDPAADSVLLFSGYGNRTILDDTWSLSSGQWSELPTLGLPPGRYAGTGGFDVDDGELVIVGGLGNAGLLNDTWTLAESAAVAPTSGAGSSWPVVAAFGVAGLGGLVVAVRIRSTRERAGAA